MSRLARTMTLGIIASLMVLVAGVALVYASVMGGVDDLFSGDRPQEDDARVVAAREAAAADLAASGESLATRTLTAVGGSRTSPPEPTSSCQVGQHNWKIDDPYDLSCDLSQVELVVLGSRSGFRGEMDSLDAALAAEGWRPAGAFGMQRVLEDYWDHRSELGTGYDVENLPAASYEKGEAAERRTLAVSWVLADSPELSGVLNAAVPTGGYAVVLTESVTYFEE